MTILIRILWIMFACSLLLHFFVYRKYSGVLKAVLQVPLMPFVPLLIWRRLKRTNVPERDKVFLALEAIIIGMMVLCVLVFALISVIAFQCPPRLEEPSAGLPAERIAVYVDGSPLSPSDRRATDSLQRVVRGRTLLRSILEEDVAGSGDEYEVEQLLGRYRDAIHLRATNEDGVFYIELAQSDLADGHDVIREIAVRLDAFTQRGSALILTGDGMKPFRIQVDRTFDNRGHD